MHVCRAWQFTVLQWAGLIFSGSADLRPVLNRDPAFKYLPAALSIFSCICIQLMNNRVYILNKDIAEI